MRRQSVAFFLGDVGFLSDPKFRKLARRLPDPDDFNSAVGAFFIALAAARRNGLPDVDVEGETDSRFAADLRAVGLLTDSGFPEKAFVGWAPSRPPRPNERRDKSDKQRRDATKSDESDESDIPSTPIPSTPFHSDKGPRARTFADPLLNEIHGAVQERYGEVGPTERDDGRADLEAFLVITRRAPTPKQRRLLDEMLDRHDLTGPAWAADIMFRHPDDPIGAVIAADKAWRAERIAEAQAAEKPKPHPRRPRGLPQTTREIMAEMAELRAVGGGS
jgi:hypothetical protein